MKRRCGLRLIGPGLVCLTIAAGCASSTAEETPQPTTEIGRVFVEFNGRFETLRLGMSKQDVDKHVGRVPKLRGPDQWVWELWDDAMAHQHVFWVQFSGNRMVKKGVSSGGDKLADG